MPALIVTTLHLSPLSSSGLTIHSGPYGLSKRGAIVRSSACPGGLSRPSRGIPDSDGFTPGSAHIPATGHAQPPPDRPRQLQHWLRLRLALELAVSSLNQQSSLGNEVLCKTFITDCSIHFELTPLVFPTDRLKITFMISHLSGRAKAWTSVECSWGSTLFLADFQVALKRLFDPVTTGREKPQELSGLRQGSGSVCDYAICFRTLAAESGWNSTALYNVFLKGLAASSSPWVYPQIWTPSSCSSSDRTTGLCNSYATG